MSEWDKRIDWVFDLDAHVEPLLRVSASGEWTRVKLLSLPEGLRQELSIRFVELDGSSVRYRKMPQNAVVKLAARKAGDYTGDVLFSIPQMQRVVQGDDERWAGQLDLYTENLAAAMRDYPSLRVRIEVQVVLQDGEEISLRWVGVLETDIIHKVYLGVPPSIPGGPAYLTADEIAALYIPKIASPVAGDLVTQAEDGGLAKAGVGVDGLKSGPTWTVFYDRSKYVAVGNKGRGTLMNQSFSALMNSITQSQERCHGARIHLVAANSGEYPLPLYNRYIVDAPIYVEYACTITGDGNPMSLIRAADGYSYDAMFYVGHSVSIDSLSVFENLRFDNNLSEISQNVAFIKFVKAAEPNLRNCEFGYTNGPQVIIERPDNWYSHWAQIVGCWFVMSKNGSSGLKISNSVPPLWHAARETFIQNCIFGCTANNTVGVDVGPNSGSISIVGCVFKSDRTTRSGNVGVLVSGASGVNIVGNSFVRYGSGSEAIVFDSSLQDSPSGLISGNAALNCSGAGYFVSGVEYAGGVAIGPNAINGFSYLADGNVNLDARAALLSVSDALSDAHALNRRSADARYQSLAMASAIMMDENKSHKYSRDGEVLVATLAGNYTLTLSDPDATGVPLAVSLVTVQDSTGGRTLTLAGNVKTPGGQALPVTSTVGARDAWRFVWDGAAWVLVSAALDVQ